MSKLDKYTDEELQDLLEADIEGEMRARGYEFGWYKKDQYAGVIYILVNPAFPNLVKIGYAKNIVSRLKSLNSNSGLPDPFHVYATYKVKKKLEDLKLHALIDSLDSNLRHTKNREFYEMSPEKAYGILSAIAQINGDESLLVFDPLKDPFIEPEDEQGIVACEPHKRAKEKLTFEMLGIPVGSVLVYKNDHSITAKTVNDQSTVEYEGNKYTMSGLVSHLMGGGSWQGGEYFLYEGEKLTTMRKRLGK